MSSFCAVQLRLVCTSANIEHFYKCLPGPRLVGGGMVGGGGGGLNTITGSIVAVPGAALPPVPLCQLRLARPLHRRTVAPLVTARFTITKCRTGAPERERESQETLDTAMSLPRAGAELLIWRMMKQCILQIVIMF